MDNSGDSISREALVARIRYHIEKAKFCGLENHEATQLLTEAADALEQIPATDFRPVVLCKDCIHCKKGKASLECEKHTYAWNNMRRWVDEDDFCKWGVKREES